MTPVDAFKFGFLKRCTEEGLSPRQIEERIEKAAGFFGDLGKGLKDFAGGTASAAWHAAPYALLAPPLAGAAVGAAGGALLSKANDDSVDPSEARDAELIAEYRMAIQDLARRKQMVHV